MPNQRDIARAAGVTQAAVSKALRGDVSISKETRRRIGEIAESLGYRPNAYVSTLMAHIRAGHPPRDRGCIALLMDASAENASTMLQEGTYRAQYKGIVDRAEALGFYIEDFFLQTPGLTSARIDKILQTRGIVGLILFPSNKKAANIPELNWDRYAVATIAYTWPLSSVNRVTTHHRHNVQMAFQKLRERGYRRIGMSLPRAAVDGVDLSWKAGFLLSQDAVPKKERIPLFIGKPGETPLETFNAWLQKWNPDALICLVGHEMEWFRELNVEVPDRMGVVCINRRSASSFSGIEENHEVVGARVVDLIAAQIHRNEYGLPDHPSLILINGTWVDGETICSL